MSKAKHGDVVKITSPKGVFEGVFLESEDENIAVLKLPSGYNIGIAQKSITKVEIIEEYKESKKSVKSTLVKQNSSLPKITILHTGGTIASKVDYKTGGVSAHFSPSELLNLFPELKDIAQIESRLIGQMMSENMRFPHYNIIAKEIEKEVKKGVKGVIVSQGTDTMHYSSAALSFALENLPIPVVFVGAQRSSDRGSSDAAINMLNAAYYISKTDTSEVSVCMHENMNDETCLILPGVKVRKMHTSQRDAFRPINAFALARVDYKRDVFDRISVLNNVNEGKFALKLFNEKLKIGLLRTHTHMYADVFEAFMKYDGLVLEGTALGQLPNVVIDEHTKEHGKIMKALEKLCAKIPVVMSSQCVYGRVNMHVYAEGRKNLDLGILGNHSDMTSETTFVKLAWLLSNYKVSDVKELIGQNIRGEISSFIQQGTFLV